MLMTSPLRSPPQDATGVLGSQTSSDVTPVAGCATKAHLTRCFDPPMISRWASLTGGAWNCGMAARVPTWLVLDGCVASLVYWTQRGGLARTDSVTRRPTWQPP